jgi:hypothetical protein
MGASFSGPVVGRRRFRPRRARVADLAQKQKPRRYNISKDANVGIGEVCDGIQDEQQEEGKQAADHNDQPGQTHPIAQQGRSVRRCPRNFDVHINQTAIVEICLLRFCPLFSGQKKTSRLCGIFRTATAIVAAPETASAVYFLNVRR